MTRNQSLAIQLHLTPAGDDSRSVVVSRNRVFVIAGRDKPKIETQIRLLDLLLLASHSPDEVRSRIIF